MIRNTVTVTDGSGAEWTIGRRLYPYWDDDAGAVDAFSLYLLGWPLWFVAHWFGWPWVVDASRDGTFVAEEKVRGWRRSRRRIQEIADAVASGSALAPEPR